MVAAKKKRTLPAALRDPEVRRRAIEASKGKPRPNRKSKKAIVHEAKVMIMVDTLVREGYGKLVQEYLDDVLKAHFVVASKPTAAGTAERKLFFSTTGLMEKKDNDGKVSIGDILAQIFANAKPVETTTYELKRPTSSEVANG